MLIISPADLWLRIARREIDPARALMDGLYKVTGDMNLYFGLQQKKHGPWEERR